MIRIRDEDKPFYVLSAGELADIVRAAQRGALLDLLSIQRQPRSGILVRFASRDQAARAQFHLAAALGSPKPSVILSPARNRRPLRSRSSFQIEQAST